MTQAIKAGDILLYDFKTWSSNLVTDGEVMEDGAQKREFNHVAVAISAREKIEADGHHVAINPISAGDPAMSVFTVSNDREAIHKALSHIQKFVGQGYDWTEIIDQGLRDLSHGFVHLPQHMILQTEAHGKICSSLVQIFLEDLGIKVVVRDGGKYASPEDIYLAIVAYLNGEVPAQTESTEEETGTGEGTGEQTVTDPDTQGEDTNTTPDTETVTTPDTTPATEDAVTTEETATPEVTPETEQTQEPAQTEETTQETTSTETPEAPAETPATSESTDTTDAPTE